MKTNTKDSEWVDEILGHFHGLGAVCEERDYDWLTQTLKARDEELLSKERADWLRSEIEKLEGMRKYIGDSEDWGSAEQEMELYNRRVHNQALTSIITRYKEELKVLESK